MVMATTIRSNYGMLTKLPGMAPGTAVDSVEDTGLGSAAGEATTTLAGVVVPEHGAMTAGEAVGDVDRLLVIGTGIAGREGKPSEIGLGVGGGVLGTTGVSGSGTTWDGGAGMDAVISVPASSPSGSGRASPSSTT